MSGRKLNVAVILVGLLVLPLVSFAESGEDLYKTYCWQCHGMQGDGMGINIPDMSVQPRDHSDTKEMTARSDEELFKAIKDGGQAIEKSVLMPPWGGVLSDEEIQSLVRYLRELCRCG
jgi:cytochrome c oxidase cbb3-type subunit 3